MQTQKKWHYWGISLFLGILWAYSLTTRTNLFFIVPLWLKAIVWVGFGANFLFLARFLIHRLRIRYGGGPAWVWLIVGAALVSLAIFLILPYQWMPFRTTHTLTITAKGEGGIILEKALSPDDNIIERSAFVTTSNVPPHGENGFFLLGDTGAVAYKRSQTGGLTLVFAPMPGTVEITWDGETQEVSFLSSDLNRDLGRWHLTQDLDTQKINLELPGTTWGEPGVFWGTLALLMPLADFVSLSSLIAGGVWLGLKLRREKRQFQMDWVLVKVWVDSLLCLLIALVLIAVGFPNFIPGYLLLFLAPAFIFFFHKQTAYLIRIDLLKKPDLARWQAIWKRPEQLLAQLNQSKWILLAGLVLISVLSAYLQLQLTQPGLGISGDSMHYLQGAENMAAGMGYVRAIKAAAPVPITGFPPFYSFVLSLGVRVGINAETSARYLNTLLLISTIGLAGWLVFQNTYSAFASLLVGAFIGFYPPILDIYAWVMTEPLFITLCLAAVLVWSWAIKTTTLWKFLVVGLIGGLAALTRLVGVALLASLALSTLIFHHGRVLKRWLTALLLGLIGVLPLAGFFFRNSQISGTLSEARAFYLAPFKKEYVQILANQLADWFNWTTFFQTQEAINMAVLVTFAVILVILILWAITRRSKKPAHQAIHTTPTLIIFSVVYLLTLVANVILLAPEQTEYGLSRYVLPLFTTFAIWLAIVLDQGLWRRKSLFTKIFILFAVIVVLSLNVSESLTFVQKPPLMFREYTDKKIACEADLGIFGDLPSDQNIYTNNCEYFYFLSGHQCLHLSMTAEDYQPGGEIYQDILEGDLIAYSESSGFEPPGLADLLSELEQYQSGCFFSFYRWPDQEQ